ncbi:hypothetical protein YTPLAS72_27340 [Nitrospira sp.]|nr:hypothetical protein YTPLAS72_27340 [Nitrospira sp.]
MNHLVFIHGRAQEHQDAAALKQTWIEAFREGLAKSQLQLPIPEQAIRFPYYGQALYDLAHKKPSDCIANVLIKGVRYDENEDAQAFLRTMLTEVQQTHDISDAQVLDLMDRNILAKGAMEWEWIRALLKAIDRNIPLASAAYLAVAFNDVWQYLQNDDLRTSIENGVRQALMPNVPTVVVSHSLGTVVSYKLLRQEGTREGWKVPLYVTLGSPLAVAPIKKRLAPNKHPECVGTWFNAMDERDTIALHPLDEHHFPITPAITNKRDIQNHTENRHGIVGYLTDQSVARQIYHALIE